MTMKHGLKIITSIFMLCISSFVSAQAVKPRLYVAIDNSGSMQRSLRKIADVLETLEQQLYQSNNGVAPIKYITFSNQFEEVDESVSLSLFSRLSNLSRGSGAEDGLIPISHIVDSQALETDGAHILLITDEGRTVVKKLDENKLAQKLLDKNITLHSILLSPMLCNKKTPLVAVGKAGFALTNQGVIDCPTEQVDIARRFNRHNSDIYRQLAKLTQGYVWDIMQLKENKTLFAQTITQQMHKKYFTVLSANVKVTGNILNGKKHAGEIIVFDAQDVSAKPGLAPVESWQWDFNADGEIDDYGPNVSTQFDTPGVKDINLHLSNGEINEQIQINVHVVE